MLYLDLDDTRAGMVLGQDVLDPRGQVLLPAGCTLTDIQLQVLHINQVRRVPIAPAPAPHDSVDTTASDGHIDAKFLFCDDRHPLIHELRRLCRQRSMRAEGERDDD